MTCHAISCYFNMDQEMASGVPYGTMFCGPNRFPFFGHFAATARDVTRR